MSAKMATLGLLEIKVFWNKGYDVIMCMRSPTKCYHVTQIILQMFDNFSISMREVIVTSSL